MKHLVPEDRGLGTAYERYCFYQLLEDWARAYEVESLLEGPVDGMAGVAGVHGVGLARRGVSVVSAVPTEAHAEVARNVFSVSGAQPGAAKVLVTGESLAEIEALPEADMVVCYHALSFVSDWRTYLRAVAKKARKVLVVTVCNPDNWGVTVVQALARLRGAKGMKAPEEWRTDVLAPELWALGRLRTHAFFDCPWWPDLQVSAGQSLGDRLKKLVSGRKSEVRFTDVPEGSELSGSFVYGGQKWPYFGGPGWTDELLPALLKHPCFEGAPVALRSRTAHLHAFVVDRRPRTPQARRRLVTAPAP